MSKYEPVFKNELVKLLDTQNELEKTIFDTFSGEQFANSTEEIRVKNVRNIFELLIPKSTWTKTDFETKNENISINGIQQDDRGDYQLIISIDNVKDTFITTSEAIGHLFFKYKMSHYAKFMLASGGDHLDLLLDNFSYWFKKIDPNEPLLVRTVIENGTPIVRCFASTSYKPIDNHALLYMSLWALDKLGMNFHLALSRIDHSSMKLDFVSDDTIELKGIGKLTYGFTLVNSEDKSKTVGIHPSFDLENSDGSSTALIIDMPITIVHRGKSLEPIMRNLDELKNIRDHIDWVISVIKLAHKEKIDDIFAYKVQQEIIKIIGPKQFEKFSRKFNEISSNNTYNLLQFFGRLKELDVPDEENAIKIKVLFWKFLKDYNK